MTEIIDPIKFFEDTLRKMCDDKEEMDIYALIDTFGFYIHQIDKAKGKGKRLKIKKELILNFEKMVRYVHALELTLDYLEKTEKLKPWKDQATYYYNASAVQYRKEIKEME